MKKWVLLAVVLSVTCHAQTAAPSPQNVVTISFSAAVLQTNEAQKDLDDLQKKFAPRQALIQALNTEVGNMKKRPRCCRR
ncbi:MAG TPA: hypothetical protein VHT24_06005 [Pseudacidobacterium sp.]|nr:hypothetical protein [Pseudacidobacterium sp.]